jgi:hypothetical protein
VQNSEARLVVIWLPYQRMEVRRNGKNAEFEPLQDGGGVGMRRTKTRSRCAAGREPAEKMGKLSRRRRFYLKEPCLKGEGHASRACLLQKIASQFDKQGVGCRSRVRMVLSDQTEGQRLEPGKPKGHGVRGFPFYQRRRWQNVRE